MLNSKNKFLNIFRNLHKRGEESDKARKLSLQDSHGILIESITCQHFYLKLLIDENDEK